MKQWIKIILGAIAFFFAGILFNSLKKSFQHVNGNALKKLAKVKKYKKQANISREKAGSSLKKAKECNNKRRTVRDKYSKILIFILFFCLPSLLFGRFIVWNEEDQVHRDYGNITNYVKSLEEEKIIFLATQGHLYQTVAHYSNAYVNMSNASRLQDEVIEEQKPSWCSRMWTKTKFYVGFISGAGITAAVLVLLL